MRAPHHNEVTLDSGERNLKPYSDPEIIGIDVEGALRVLRDS
jgi:hypothetical protein